MAEVGVRVVRGPDWQWGDQDGGEGFCGTVVEVGRPGSSSTPDRTVVVHWDTGARTNYRVGYQSAYDLRLLDNAPVGVKHANHICDGCKKQGIYGLQWSCTRCFDYDLCTVCYMADKHDTSHPFKRLDNANCSGIEVPARKSSSKVPLQGIFVGAKVVRGPDWDWGNQDGGAGEVGRVTEIRGWDGESSRSVASVVWATSGVNNVYRLGHKGKVDLKCEQAASCGHIYINHLPVLGRSAASTGTAGTATAVAATSGRPPFLVGERVRVSVPVQQLRSMQEGHGGWNHKMSEYVAQVGVVHRITDKGDVRVQYDGCCTRWTIHPSALSRVGPPPGGAPTVGSSGAGHQAIVGAGLQVAGSSSTAAAETGLPAASAPHHHHHHHYYTPGDRVTVIAEEDKVKNFQKGHGEWIDYMRAALSKTGVVAKVYPDGDLRVNVEGKTWTFSPACVTPIATATVNYDDKHGRNAIYGSQPHHDTHHNSTDDTPINNTTQQQQNASVDPALPCDQSVAPTVAAVGGTNPPLTVPLANSRLVDKLVREAAQGHLQAIVAILATNPELLECGSGGKTALQVACHQGHLAVVRFLLDRGAHTATQDQDGDTPLHYAAFGNQVEVLELLIRRRASINAVNCGRCTALHVAVNKQHPACVALLLHYNADANIQDSYGDTALHDAIGKDSVEIVEALTNWSRLNLTRRNNRGFNVLHHAALKGNNYATEKLVSRGRQFVDVRKDDGFAALHLACLNGHRHVAETLLSLGRADPNLTNNKRQTPLLLAIAQGHVSLVELLVVHYGADLNCADEDGETALHLSLHRLNQQPEGGTGVSGGYGLPFSSRTNTSDGIMSNEAYAGGSGLSDGGVASNTGGLGGDNQQQAASCLSSGGGSSSATGSSDASSTESPTICNVLTGLPLGSSVWLGVACLLVQRGASVTALNSRGLSPVQDLTVLQALQSYTAQDATGGGISNATRLDLDMKALDLAAESFRSTLLESQQLHHHHQNIVIADPTQDQSGGGVNGGPPPLPPPNPSHHHQLPPSSSMNVSAVHSNLPVHVSGVSGPATIPHSQPQQPAPPQRSTSQPASPARFAGAGGGGGPPSVASSSQPASPAHVASSSPQSEGGAGLCVICLEGPACVRFEPCGHSLTCEECGARVKRCLHCHTMVAQKVRHDGRILPSEGGCQQPSSERLRYLETKIADIEEAHCCGICMERRRSVAFLCGHSACALCAHTLSTCHMCRKPITNKINLY